MKYHLDLCLRETDGSLWLVDSNHWPYNFAKARAAQIERERKTESEMMIALRGYTAGYDACVQECLTRPQPWYRRWFSR